MASRQSIVVKVRISGLRETIRAFRELPKDASNELRTATKEISETLAAQVAAAARSSSSQSALVAGTVKAIRDRVPAIQAGGGQRVGRNRKPAHKILFGANFGATYLRQFRPHRPGGDNDYWFFSTVEQRMPEVEERWNRVADDVLTRWGSGGVREV